MEAEIEHVLHVGREEHRHVQAGEQRLGGARQGGRLAGGIVSHHGDRAAGARYAHEVAVPERVGRAVEARSLAVPEAEHAVVARAGQGSGHLASPRRRGAQLLVQPGHVAHVVLGAELALALELLVETAERRALVAGHEGARVQSEAAVGPVLVERQPDQGLDAGEQDAALLQDVPVGERDLAARGPPALAREAEGRRSWARGLRRSGRSRSAVGFTRLSSGTTRSAAFGKDNLPLAAHRAPYPDGLCSSTSCPPLLRRFRLMSTTFRTMVNGNDHFC